MRDLSFDLPRYQCHFRTLKSSPDPAVIAWLVRHDAELALPTVPIAEIAFGIQKIRPDQRAERLEQGLSDWRRRFADRIFGLTEEAAMAYGEIMSTAMRQGRGMSAPDGMIAAISRVNGDRLGDAELGRLRHDRSQVVLSVGVDLGYGLIQDRSRAGGRTYRLQSGRFGQVDAEPFAAALEGMAAADVTAD